MSDKKVIIKSVIIGSVCGMLFSVILMCICAAVILSTGLLPSDITSFVMLAVNAAGAMFGGFISARVSKFAGLIVGLITGGVIFLVVTLAGFTASNNPVTVLTLIRFAVLLLTASAGGILGVNKKEKIHI